ncbi:MAG: BMP family ABC transporter substrate-binding protein [Firmicutes bacterium]|nr:BMP family ABC transporter substrate-binding protein [Bacillota bacterium]MDY5771311.1 BMP family ABC transporter substrate-binding protein [Anaerovoracaceae bacterium]
MKKFLTVLLILTMVFAMTACGGNDEGGDAESYAVAMITDYGDITDESFNQTTYEACKEFCEANGIKFNYFKPAGDNTADRVAMVDQAVGEGYNVIVMPGYAFGGTVVEAAPNYPDVKFIVLDVSKGDILEAAVTKAGETYDYQPDNWNLEDYFDMSNVYCVVYQEEIAGYMAGYAAVKLGYEKLGFLGGMAVPAVVRYGQGFVQGCDAAAAEMNKDIDLNYVYGGQFFGNADITAVMDTWYKGGTEVVFAAGGSIYTSACEAAVKVGGKVIGVDTDQAPIIDGAYGDGITVTSAMKGLYPSTYNALEDIVLNGNWDKYVGQIANLGIISDNPEENYVQIAPSTQFKDGAFTEDDYKAMVAKLNAGEIKVDNNIAEMPKTTNTKVNVQGQIVG